MSPPEKIGITLPYLTFPYFTLLNSPYLTVPYLTWHYFPLPYLTFTLPYLTLPYLTLPYLTLPYFTLLRLSHSPYLTLPCLQFPNLTLINLTVSYTYPLGIKNQEGKYVIPMPSWSRTVFAAGTKVRYYHEKDLDINTIFIPGPTTEKLIIVVGNLKTIFSVKSMFIAYLLKHCILQLM